MAKFSFLPYRDAVRAGAPTGDASSRAARVRTLRNGDGAGGAYVLYWMQMFLRAENNAALDEAVRQANERGLPLLVYQGLNPDYPEANDRTHTFILECARDVARSLADREIPYRFHLRRSAGAEPNAAAELVRHADAVVVDDFPAFILPRMTSAMLHHTAGSGVPVTAVDDNGLVPLGEIPDRQYAAYTIRPRLHRKIPEYLVPEPSPTLSVTSVPDLPLPAEQFVDLTSCDDAALRELVESCDIDHEVGVSARYAGGRSEALARLRRFVGERLHRYEERNDPSSEASSGLSPYLHFGCLSTAEIVSEVLASDAPDAAIDEFLEELVVRRELTYNFCRYTPVECHDTLRPLPDWARTTLSEHAGDEREFLYAPEVLEAGRTHDELWNAAQAELVATGSFHGYLRMLWGKNVIRWTETYEEAQAFMVRMHHRYSLDGRNPNTYSNILWCFGLHDRAFKEQDVLGKLRPLKSSSTRRKFDVDAYMQRIREIVADADVFASPPKLGNEQLELDS